MNAKRVISAASAAAMVLSTMALPTAQSLPFLSKDIIVSAGGGGGDEDMWYDYFVYEYINGNEINIWSFYNDPNYHKTTEPSKYLKDGKFLVFPTWIEGKKVTALSCENLHDWSKGSAGPDDYITSVYVPSTVNSINGLGKIYAGDGTEVLEGFTIYTPAGSYAEQYAKENGITVVNTDEYEEPDPNAQKKSVEDAEVFAKDQVYTGKAIRPEVTVTLDGETLVAGTDYKTAYKNHKKCGKASFRVTGIGDYEGEKIGNFIIKPKKVAAKKLTSPKQKTVKLTWKKAAGGVTGYQVQVALNKKFTKGKKTAWAKKASATSKTIKGLKKGKKYFARVRAYKTVGGKKYTGKWSTVKSVKCK